MDPLSDALGARQQYPELFGMLSGQSLHFFGDGQQEILQREILSLQDASELGCVHIGEPAEAA